MKRFAKYFMTLLNKGMEKFVHELKLLVEEGKSRSELANYFNVHASTIRRWLAKYSLSKPREHKCACGETRPEWFTAGRMSECKLCRSQRQTELYNRYKQEAVNYKGGECQKCGYKKCLASLDFHHLDPNEKDTNWKNMKHWSFENTKAELDKCILVCRNCHGEIHDEEYRKRREENRLRIKEMRENAPPKAPNFQTHICACGKQFVGEHHRKYCSHECASKAIRRVERPSKQQLDRLLWQKPTTKLAEDFGVTCQAVRKWAKGHGLKTPPRGYWTKFNYENP